MISQKVIIPAHIPIPAKQLPNDRIGPYPEILSLHLPASGRELSKPERQCTSSPQAVKIPGKPANHIFPAREQFVSLSRLTQYKRIINRKFLNRFMQAIPGPITAGKAQINIGRGQTEISAGKLGSGLGQLRLRTSQDTWFIREPIEQDMTGGKTGQYQSLPGTGHSNVV